MVKTMECGCTNRDERRFLYIMKMFRTQHFHYPENVFTPTRDVTCTACHQKGHTKKNKACAMHPSQPVIQFDESDDEDS